MKVAIIPARGGSKRIPRKNIREFCGKPMIAYSIEAAKKSGLFDEVFVSTDNQDIINISEQYGAKVPFTRPAELADDYTGTTEVINHAINELLKKKYPLNAVCCIYATAPFIEPNDLASGLELLETGNWEYVFAACEFSAPVYRSFKKNHLGGIEMFFPEYYSHRSQDLPTALHDTGQFYWAYKETWLENKQIFTSQSTAIVIPEWRVQDLDKEDDWVNAEIKYRILQEGDKIK